MRPSFKTAVLISLTYFLCFSGSVEAQSKPTTAATTAAPVPTPVQPTFVNTPGLEVNSVYNGMTVMQDSVLSISASLHSRRISAIAITVAKKDASSNTTIAQISSGSIVRTTQLWNVSSSAYPVGEYLINLVVTPNTTDSQPITVSPTQKSSSTFLTPPAGSNPTSVIPGPTNPSPSNIQAAEVVNNADNPSVYYWQATVRVVVNTNNNTNNNDGKQNSARSLSMDPWALKGGVVLMLVMIAGAGLVL